MSGQLASIQIGSSLTEQQRAELASCESVIERGVGVFYEVGTALRKIRDERLHRASHSTFEEYCQERWAFKRRKADRFIDAALIVENLSPIGLIAPQSESQIRSLAPLEPAEQRVVWEQAALEANGQPTAIQVESIAKTLKQLIKERIAARESVTKPSVAQTPEPPFQSNELRQLRKEMKQTGARVHNVMNFVRAIETLSNPSLPLSEVAHEIRSMDTPDKDWCGKSLAAEKHLTLLAKDLVR